jgi:hypothetical protein
MLILEKHRAPFAAFARQMLETRDFDPNYFAVKGVVEARGYDLRTAYDFCVTFNGFYNFGSADRFFKDPNLDPAALPFGTSRRGFRGNRKVFAFIDGMRSLRPLVMAYCMSSAPPDYRWSSIYNALLQVPGCGHWSAYYVTDMMKVVLGFKISAPDFGFLGSSPNMTGPTAGIALLTGRPLERVHGDVPLHQAVFAETVELGVPWTGMEEMESVLCNYLSLRKGRYYCGRDIDRQIPMMQGLGPEWWEARRKFFPAECLGELNGWSGIRKELMGTFDPEKRWNTPTT